MTDILDGQYPNTWGEYVGQDAAKEALRTMAESANLRGDLLPHTMISCPTPGSGKTALGVLTARQVDRPVLKVGGSMTMDAALTMFEDVKDGDIVLYDEFHQIANGGPKKYEWLLNYLENGVILTPYGEEKVPKVTFLTMTTDKGLLLPAVLDRFKHVELEDYTDAEAAQIAVKLSAKVMDGQPTINPNIAEQVARAGNNAPRRMRDLLMTMRDLATIGQITPTPDGDYPMQAALRLSGLTEDGLTKEAVRYLVTFREAFGRGTAGESTLKARLGYGRGTGLKDVEKLLTSKGYIHLSGRGRMLTGDGSVRARALAA